MDDVASESNVNDVNKHIEVIENSANTAITSDSGNLGQTKKLTPKKDGKNESKNSSLEEDMLGANSLLMSDSDSEECEAKEKVEQVLGTDQQESTTLVSNNDKNEPENKTDTVVALNKLNMPPIATDNPIIPMEIFQNEMKQDNDAAEAGITTKKKKKFSAILDSDSDENETKVAPKQTTVIKSKYSALIDSESESESDNGETRQNEMKQMEGKNKFKIFDFDSDSDDKDYRKPSKGATKKKFTKKAHSIQPGLIDSDSDSNNETIDQEELENLQQTELDAKAQMSGEQKKPMRASAKKALDEMQTIQSEQQRLHREAHVSVPYHKPKRYTLQEFLKRRTIIKPAVESECSPAATIMKKKNLKMTPEELEEYARLMEERAKEATEFFKSESGSEDEDEEMKDNVGVMDIAQQETANLEKIEESKIEHEKSVDGVAKVDISIDQPKDVETMNVENTEIQQQLPQTSTIPLITEVLKLPNLDLSTLHVTEKDITPVSMKVASPASPGLSIADLREIEEFKMTLFNDQILTDSPTIKGNSNMIIDLESGDMIEKKPTGADNLLKRLLATHRARKTKTSETVNILSTENGKLEMAKVNIHINDDESANKDHKPGAAYVKLKENLKTLIKKKRVEEMKKKQEDENEYNKCLEGDDDDYDDEEYEEEYELVDDEKVAKKKQRLDNIVIDDEENTLDNSDVIDDEAQEDEQDEGESAVDELEAENDEQEKDEIGNEDENDKEVKAIVEIDDNETDEDSSDSDDEIDNEEFKIPIAATQRKNRIIKAFAADSDDDDMELLKTQIPTIQSNVSNSVFGFMNSPQKSFISLPCSDIGVNNTQELLSLCSGSFDATQNPTTTVADTVIISQIPMTQQSHFKDASEELLGLCSGNFEDNSVEQQVDTQTTESISITDSVQNPNDQAEEERAKTADYKFLSSDDEEKNATVEDDTRRRSKKLLKKLKKRQVKLVFSDDEDENEESATRKDADSDVVDAENENYEEESENDVEMPETYVEYDSEENEITVQMTKKDRVKHAENFFEKEAELSESDWGSADEDEKNMDDYDIELGDEEQFDRGKLQQELGQIHARKMLDEDIREVRKIQELLFEDEETDGVGRQRQFRWKNVESGFSLDDMKGSGKGEDGVDGESGDEEQKQEHLWRKIRFEREQLLKDQGFKENSQEFETTTLGINSPLTTILLKNSSKSKSTTPILGSNGKKIQITKHTASTISAKQSGSPFLISSNMTTTKTKTKSTTMASILQPKEMRGSFLTRDKEMLTKFSNPKKPATGFDEDDETAGTVSTKGKNFVFTTLTKEEHEQRKRKADDLINSSSETGTNFMKKPRTNDDKQCLIDQLLH